MLLHRKPCEWTFDGAVSASLESGGSTYTGSFTASNGVVSDVSDNYPNYTFSGSYSKIYVVMEMVQASTGMMDLMMETR